MHPNVSPARQALGPTPPPPAARVARWDSCYEEVSHDYGEAQITYKAHWSPAEVYDTPAFQPVGTAPGSSWTGLSSTTVKALVEPPEVTPTLPPVCYATMLVPFVVATQWLGPQMGPSTHKSAYASRLTDHIADHTATFGSRTQHLPRKKRPFTGAF
jgi:hypothetical protein